MKISCIYTITNIVNGKRYIGSTVDFSKRAKEHLYRLKRGSHNNKHLQNAWTKYGSDAFRIGIVSIVSQEELLDCEQSWLDGFDPEYNICRNARGGGTGLITKGGRKQLRWARLGKTMPPESRAKISAAKKGRKNSLSHRQGISLGLRGRTLTSEHKENISRAMIKLFIERKNKRAAEAVPTNPNP